MGFPKSKEKASTGHAVNTRSAEIEYLNSPSTRHVNDNAASIFSAFVFVVIFAVTAAVGYVITGAMNIWVLCIGFVLATVSIFTVHIASQWERDVILRLGAFNRMAARAFTSPSPSWARRPQGGPAHHAHGLQRRGDLTSDLVPVNVDAAIFWMIWDAEKACMEVENYYDAVSMASQTALRDAIGRNSLSDVTVHRDKLDQELRDKIEGEDEPVGHLHHIGGDPRHRHSKELQNAMAASAKAEREKERASCLPRWRKTSPPCCTTQPRSIARTRLPSSFAKCIWSTKACESPAGLSWCRAPTPEGFVDKAVEDAASAR